MEIDVGLLDSMMNGWFNHEKQELLTGFKINNGETILDIGCGDGMFSQFCAKYDTHIILADIDPAKISAAESRVLAANPKSLKSLVTDAAPIPLESNSVDKVIAMEVLEHVEDPLYFISELYRVARPGAYFLISVPGTTSEKIQKKLAPESYFLPPNHIRIFEPKELESLLTKHNFIVEKQINYGFYWSMWWSFFWSCNQDFCEPWHPLLQSWQKTWGLVLQSQDGAKIKAALDNLMPKSQALIARKPYTPR